MSGELPVGRHVKLFLSELDQIWTGRTNFIWNLQVSDLMLMRSVVQTNEMDDLVGALRIKFRSSTELKKKKWTRPSVKIHIIKQFDR